MTNPPTGDVGRRLAVLADANVLYSRVLRDILIDAADEGVVAIRWSRAILNEVVEHLQMNNPTFGGEEADLLIGLHNDAYPTAEVTSTAAARRKVNELELPDEDDRHVLATAVSARADILCTNNIEDFPPGAMASVQIELVTADALLARLVTAHPIGMLAAFRTTVATIVSASDGSTIAALRRSRANETAGLIEALVAKS